MKETNKPEEQPQTEDRLTPTGDKEPNLNWLPAFTALITIAAISVYAIYFGGIKGLPLGSPDNWAQFGDFIGGLLNPLIGAASVYILVTTLRAQRQELQEQRAELAKSVSAQEHQHKAIERQNTEALLFNWIKIYREISADFFYPGQEKGGGSLAKLVRDLSPKTGSPYSSGTENSQEIADIRYAELVYSDIDERRPRLFYALGRLMRDYHKAYRKNEATLGPMLRTLYRIFLWIDTLETENHVKWHYTSLIRAQLSQPELTILLLNSLSPEEEKMTRLVNKYAILDNLSLPSDPFFIIFTKITQNVTENELEYIATSSTIYGITTPGILSRTRESISKSVSSNAFNSELAKKDLGLLR